jgi:tellurite resistance-related uncharacterized protein
MPPPPPWPPDLVPTRRTAEFTETTIPAGLLRAHSTRAGTWARLHVLEGQLLFREPLPGAERKLGPGIHAVIHPEREHQVAPLGPVRFFVEFLARP